MRRLSYIGLGVADVSAWQLFAAETLGLMWNESSGASQLRLDKQAYRLALHHAADDDIQYIGLECDDAMDVDAARRVLDGAGIACADLAVAECAERQVAGGCWLLDPDGLRVELIWGAAAAVTPFRSDLDTGFVTGDGGLGHVVLSVSDTDRSIAFYEKLGFKISDFINAAMGPDFTLRIAFMHCNPRHHSLAMAQAFMRSFHKYA